MHSPIRGRDACRRPFGFYATSKGSPHGHDTRPRMPPPSPPRPLTRAIAVRPPAPTFGRHRPAWKERPLRRAGPRATDRRGHRSAGHPDPAGSREPPPRRTYQALMPGILVKYRGAASRYSRCTSRACEATNSHPPEKLLGDGLPRSWYAPTRGWIDGEECAGGVANRGPPAAAAQ